MVKGANCLLSLGEGQVREEYAAWLKAGLFYAKKKRTTGSAKVHVGFSCSSQG